MIESNQTPKHIHISYGDRYDNYRIMWLTDDYAESYVYYGEEELNKIEKGTTNKLQYGPGYIHHVELKNLVLNAKYKYQVGDENSQSKTYHFKVKNFQSDMEFKFIAFGDMGTHYVQSTPTAESICMEAKDVDFLFHVGDMAYAFGNFTRWDKFFNNIECSSPYIPYMISPGNRDEKQVMVERFSMPNNQYSDAIPMDKRVAYWSKEVGSTLLISLSILDEYKKLDDPQLLWLEKELKAAHKKMKTKNSNFKWIIIFVHTPLYSSSNGHAGGNKELKKVLEPLMVKYEVTLGIYGDDHVYERTFPIANDEPDTITPAAYDYKPCFMDSKKPIHLLVGTGGIDLDGWTTNVPPPYSAHRELSNGFIKVSVQKSMINVKFIRTDRTIGDEFFIMKDVVFEGQMKPEEDDSISVVWILPFLLIFILIVFKNFTFLKPKSKI